MDEWQATRARESLPDIIDAAVNGAPQLVRRRDGAEVVVVSKEYFERTQPNMRDYLLKSGYAGDNDEFDKALKKVREGHMGLPTPRSLSFDD